MHPIHLFSGRCSFYAGLNANLFKQTTHFTLLGALFEPIFEWMGAAQVIDKYCFSQPPILHLRTTSPITESSLLHTIHFYIPHQASSYILAIRSLYNSNRLSGKSIRCWFQFVARLLWPRSHTPYDTFYNHTLHYNFRKYPTPLCKSIHSIKQLINRLYGIT